MLDFVIAVMTVIRELSLLAWSDAQKTKRSDKRETYVTQGHIEPWVQIALNIGKIGQFQTSSLDGDTLWWISLISNYGVSYLGCQSLPAS